MKKKMISAMSLQSFLQLRWMRENFYFLSLIIQLQGPINAGKTKNLKKKYKFIKKYARQAISAMVSISFPCSHKLCWMVTCQFALSTKTVLLEYFTVISRYTGAVISNTFLADEINVFALKFFFFCWWMREFNATFAQVRPNRQAGTTVMRWTALVARMKFPSNMAAPGIEPGSRG